MVAVHVNAGCTVETVRDKDHESPILRDIRLSPNAKKARDAISPITKENVLCPLKDDVAAVAADAWMCGIAGAVLVTAAFQRHTPRQAIEEVEIARAIGIVRSELRKRCKCDERAIRADSRSRVVEIRSLSVTLLDSQQRRRGHRKDDHFHVQ
jgi:hypothetical protein